MNTTQKPKGRDYPLSPTPETQNFVPSVRGTVKTQRPPITGSSDLTADPQRSAINRSTNG